MTCSNCGAELAEGAVFCSTCGTPQVNDPGAQTITIKAPEDPILMALRKELSGEYEVERELGRGGMAVVYKAVEVQLHRTVALKVVPPENAGGGATAERFKREARMAASLDHANIIPVYRVGQANNLLYMAMKFVEGRAVDAIIEQQGPLPIPVVLEVLRCSAHALAYAHDHGIVHRDIKGANILIDKDGRVLVSDFGIARAMEEKSMTASGMIIGTPYFMSPEQCGGLKVGPQSDQYSLGIMAFQMLTGEVPFDADSVMGIIQHHYMTPVPDIAAVRDDVPPELLAAIYRALNKDVADRYEDTHVFADALDAVPEPEGTTRRDGQNMLKALTTGAGDAIPKIRTASLPPLAGTGVVPRPASMPNIPTVKPKTGGQASVPAPKPRAGLMVGGGLAVAAAAAAGVYFGVLKPKQDAAAPPVAAVLPESGYVKFANVPAGATITVDDKPVSGDSGLFPRGDVIYKVSAPGYKPVSDAVAVAAGKTRTVDLAMEKIVVAAPPPKTPPGGTKGPAPVAQAAAGAPAAPKEFGSLTVATDPVFANVAVDGAVVGQGRVIGAKVSVGTHTVRISADGYEAYSRSITVTPNNNTSLGKITLTKTGGP
ncbi:MAG: protein kinase [Gemmatimonadetes bacterium]|nr:protein kinase [Gemmatimonadota bacterium]